MSRLHAFLMAFLFLVSFTFILPGVTSSALPLSSSVASTPDNYRGHSQVDSYNFASRDGWTTFNATSPQHVESRTEKAGVSAGLLNGLEAFGDAVSALITWCVFSILIVSPYPSYQQVHWPRSRESKLLVEFSVDPDREQACQSFPCHSVLISV